MYDLSHTHFTPHTHTNNAYSHHRRVPWKTAHDRCTGPSPDDGTCCTPDSSSSASTVSRAFSWSAASAASSRSRGRCAGSMTSSPPDSCWPPSPRTAGSCSPARCASGRRPDCRRRERTASGTRAPRECRCECSRAGSSARCDWPGRATWCETCSSPARTRWSCRGRCARPPGPVGRRGSATANRSARWRKRCVRIGYADLEQV